MSLTENDPLQSEVFLYECLGKIDAGNYGHYAEFGVLYGNHFVPIAAAARASGKAVYAVDSFRGMAEPTENDGPGAEQYHQGRFDQHGPDRFIETMDKAGFKCNEYYIVEGFIPEILMSIRKIKFCFAYVDLDQYQPTMDVLDFLWERIDHDSIIMVDDFSWERNCLAALAYKHFFEKHRDEIDVKVCGREAAFSKKRPL